jgi:Ca2+-binding RTX toxin-like protein
LVSVNQTDASDQQAVNALGGNDFLSAASVGAGVISLTLDGGTGNDTILGSSGADLLLGGDGDDSVDGNPGGDTALLGIGNDTFTWDPGDGSDVVEGQAGVDALLFNGSNANETINISPNGGRSLLTRDVGAIIMDMDDVETLTVNTFGGSDFITVNNMAGTDVNKVAINLAGVGGVADGLVDTVTVNATSVADTITFTVSPSGVITVNGLSAAVEIRNFDAKDKLVINTGIGNDNVNTSGLNADIALVINTGDGNDTVRGRAGFDSFQLGSGVNTLFATTGGDYASADGGSLLIFPG